VTTLQPGQSEATKQLEPLGRRVLETPPTEAVQTATLDDNDVALVMTEGLDAFTDVTTLGHRLEDVGSTDAPAIRDALMQSSAASKADRTVLVITGPYGSYVDPVLSDLSRAVAALESRMDSLAQSDRPVAAVAAPASDEAVKRLEDRLLPEIELLKEDLRAKAGSIDVLELDEKVKGFAALVGGKADKSDVLSLQSELLKLSVATDEARAVAKSAIEQDRSQPPPLIQTVDPVSEESNSSWQRSLLFKVAGIVLVIGFASAFAGAWLQSRLARRSAQAVAPATASPSPTLLATTQPTPSPLETPAAGPTEIVVKPGDSLKKLAQEYNVPEQTIMELNPAIKRWNLVQSGQKILVPPAPVAASSPPVPTAANSPAGTIEVVVGPGDSINRFAQRYGTTPDKIRELNPQITNWASIQTGQKLLMPVPPSG
jgi:LysM repeat protein